MELYRLALCILLCSHQLFADSVWSHIPGVGVVQLSELNTEQHSALAQHLKLTSIETDQWLAELSERLDSLSCSTLEQQSQPLPDYIAPGYKVISYAGLLKWYSEDKDKKTHWWLPWLMMPSLSQLHTQLADLSVQLHQPLLLTELQLEQKGEFFLISGSSSPTYFALRLKTTEQPELLWSVSPSDAAFKDLAGAMAQPLLMQETSSQPLATSLALLLPNTGESEQKTLLYKVDLWTGAVHARLINDQNVSGLSGALALYDQNRDSHPETLLLCSKAGQIWQAQIENNQFYDLRSVADFSGLKFTDVQFIRTLYAAVPVAGSGSDFHSRRSQWLLLLSALQQQESVVIVLKLQSEQNTTSSDLVNRTLPELPKQAVFTEHDWQQIQQTQGWYSQLDGRLTQVPIVAAGVLYLPLLRLSNEKQCDLEQAFAQLMALHLHHASSVYRHPVLSLEKTAGALAVKANAQGGFALIEKNNQQVLIENMLEISPDCLHCSKTMQQDSFPRWQLMGTYQNEDGAYE